MGQSGAIWKMILYAVYNKETDKFLKGRGTTLSLVWYKTAYLGSFHKRRQTAEKIVKKLNQKDNLRGKVDIYELELILHGTIGDIIEKEMLS